MMSAQENFDFEAGFSSVVVFHASQAFFFLGFSSSLSLDSFLSVLAAHEKPKSLSIVGDDFLAGSSFLVLVLAPQPPQVVVSSLSSLDGGGSSTSVMPENLLLPFLAFLSSFLVSPMSKLRLGPSLSSSKSKALKSSFFLPSFFSLSLFLSLSRAPRPSKLQVLLPQPLKNVSVFLDSPMEMSNFGAESAGLSSSREISWKSSFLAASSAAA
jgi:hypothetical protein